MRGGLIHQQDLAKRISKNVILVIERAAINGRHREEIDKNLRNLSPIIRSEEPERTGASTLAHLHIAIRSYESLYLMRSKPTRQH